MKVIKIAMSMLAMLFLLANSGQCQALREWVHQKKTQKQYLVEQIAAQQAYLDLLGEGTRVIRAGWGAIQLFKTGEIDLHALFLGSLDRVSPHLRGNTLITEILSMQYIIIEHHGMVGNLLRSSDWLPGPESRSVARAYSGLLLDCAGLIEHLADLLGNDRLQMDDFQRMDRIQKLHGQMKGLFALSKGWLDDSLAITGIRKSLRTDLSSSYNIFGHQGTEK